MKVLKNNLTKNDIFVISGYGPFICIRPSKYDLSVKGGTSKRCYRTRRGQTDEQRYAIISLYFDGRIQMNGPYPEITNISFLVKLFFKTFISLKHLSDHRTVGLSDYSYGPFYTVCHIDLLYTSDCHLVLPRRKIEKYLSSKCYSLLHLKGYFHAYFL
jgi:hypothetical protein